MRGLVEDACKVYEITSHHTQNKRKHPLVLRKDDGSDQYVQWVWRFIVNKEEIQGPIHKKKSVNLKHLSRKK
jgi:hypothetical protein